MWRYNLLTLIAALLLTGSTHAQELFVYSEPASNMPAHSAGLRLSNWLMDDKADSRINYHLIPELMWGINNKVMVHAEAFISNTNGYRAEGLGVYAKYRFFSHDRVYHHFRMAAFVRGATNNNDIHQEELAVNGHNTGYQAGLIATQLLHKVALSATGYYEQVTDNTRGNEFPVNQSRSAYNYSLSAGRLMWPGHYTSYRQTNVNLMLEAIGQAQQGGKYFTDLAIALQFIFNSQTRLDIGYRRELAGNMLRTAPNGFMLRAEHLVFSLKSRYKEK